MFHALNSIALRRKARVFIPSKNVHVLPANRLPMVAAFLQNVQALGYVVSPTVCARLLTLDEPILIEFHTWLITELKEGLGGKRYKPMYPNFPKQVAEASDAELYINAILHYCGDMFGVRIMPEYEAVERSPLVEQLHTLKPLGLIENPDVIFDELMGSKTSPSETDKADITTCLSNGISLTITEVPIKETLAYAIAQRYKLKTGHLGLLMPLCKTSVDVLRVAVALSDGDVSLTEDCKLDSFNRVTRRMLLAAINKIDPAQAAEDMMRWRGKFKRLGERLHPGEFQKQYPRAAEAFRLIRNEGAETFNSKVELALMGKSSITAVSLLDLLTTRPGDFARRLDHVVRTSQVPAAVVDAFMGVTDKISTTVLWQVYKHFNTRDILVAQPERIFFPKGSTAHPLRAKNELKSLGLTGIMIAQVAINALHKRYSSLPKLGKVWIDPKVDKLLIPMNNRAAQAMLRQAGRGSRFPLDQDKDTVRLFMYWKDQPNDDGYSGGRVDLDLSALLFDANWNFVDHCSWTQLRASGMHHSGDITSAPKGASEFLDIDLTKLNSRAAYVVASVTCYTGQKLSAMEVAYAGWMSRQGVNSGEIYEPKTVEGRVDLRTPATVVAPLIIDVKKREVIWADMTISQDRGSWVGSAYQTLGAVGQAVSQLGWLRPSIGDVVLAHCQARGGELVANREDADLVVAEDGDISPFDVAKIASELL